jgi:hypothetical protein
MPSFSPESVVGVRRGRVSDYEAFVFTASPQIWATLTSRDVPPEGPVALAARLQRKREQSLGIAETSEPALASIVVAEHVATLEASVAGRAIAAWEAMLSEVASDRRRRLGLDGESFGFGRAPAGGGMLGETWSPSPRSRAGALVTLATTIADHVLATADVHAIVQAAEDVIAHPRATA